jgi:hypothetical protein
MQETEVTVMCEVSVQTVPIYARLKRRSENA